MDTVERLADIDKILAAFTEQHQLYTVARFDWNTRRMHFNRAINAMHEFAEKYTTEEIDYPKLANEAHNFHELLSYIKEDTEANFSSYVNNGVYSDLMTGIADSVFDYVAEKAEYMKAYPAIIPKFDEPSSLSNIFRYLNKHKLVDGMDSLTIAEIQMNMEYILTNRLKGTTLEALIEAEMLHESFEPVAEHIYKEFSSDEGEKLYMVFITNDIEATIAEAEEHKLQVSLELQSLTAEIATAKLELEEYEKLLEDLSKIRASLKAKLINLLD